MTVCACSIELKVSNRARIDGYFYTQYDDPCFFDKGFGLYNGFKRKKVFYMYKSYQWSL
jgi:hypothetical protein